jgi:hypothetical protein
VTDRLPELPQTRTVSDPTNYAPLRGFSCGSEHPYERDVNDAIGQLLDLSPEDAACYEVRVAELPSTRQLVGISVFSERRFTEDPEYADAIGISVVSVNRPFREDWRMPDGITRIGTFLLCDVLAQVEDLWGDPMPYVWGAVHRNNKRCQRLLSKHGFYSVRNGDPSNAYFVHLRNAELPWSTGFSPQVMEAVERASS